MNYDDQIVPVKGGYVYVVNKELKSGDWSIMFNDTAGHTILKVNHTAQADLSNRLRSSKNFPVRKVIGHTGIKLLQETNLTKFDVQCGCGGCADWDEHCSNPEIII